MNFPMHLTKATEKRGWKSRVQRNWRYVKMLNCTTADASCKYVHMYYGNIVQGDANLVCVCGP